MVDRLNITCANMSLKFSNICRLCMSQSEALLPLFKDNDNLPNRIMNLLPLIKIEADDGMPSQICQLCIHNINSFNSFKIQCEATEATLRSYLDTQNLDCQSKWGTSSSDEVCGQNNSSEELDIPCNSGFVECKTELDVNYDVGESVKVESDDAMSLVDDPVDNKELGSNHKMEKSSNVEGSRYQSASGKGNETEKVDPEVLECELCGRRFKLKKQLREHLRRHTGARPHVCNECGRRFADSSGLQKHMLSHSGLRMHVCDICGKRFTLAAHLKTHLLVHSGVKAHMCEVCGKSYSQVGGLMKHNMIHTGERPFSCELCSKSFSQKNSLQIHIATHTGQRPYVCNICGKNYAQRSHLRTHALTHSGLKRYTCKLCGVGYTKKKNLEKHISRHSSQEVISLEFKNQMPPEKTYNILSL